jgi:nicotinate-nucleotide pyrophosphorylase
MSSGYVRWQDIHSAAVRGAHGLTKGRISQIEQGQISGQDVLARFAEALGGRLHQAIVFDDGDVSAIAQSG